MIIGLNSAPCDFYHFVFNAVIMAHFCTTRRRGWRCILARWLVQYLLQQRGHRRLCCRRRCTVSRTRATARTVHRADQTGVHFNILNLFYTILSHSGAPTCTIYCNDVISRYPHFPMQNSRKITSSTSSTSIAPVTLPAALAAYRSSSAAITMSS